VESVKRAAVPGQEFLGRSRTNPFRAAGQAFGRKRGELQRLQARPIVIC
jgi:hypothetical protein